MNLELIIDLSYLSSDWRSQIKVEQDLKNKVSKSQRRLKVYLEILKKKSKIKTQKLVAQKLIRAITTIMYRHKRSNCSIKSAETLKRFATRIARPLSKLPRKNAATTKNASKRPTRKWRNVTKVFI